MPPSRKRPREVIDLTGDEEDGSHRLVYRKLHAPPSSSSSSARESQPWSSSLPASSSSSYISLGPPQHMSSQRNTQPYDNDDEELEIVNLTQSEDGPPRELYGSLENKVVGLRYYNGVASAQEWVICRREPTNQYDSNAIRVTNVMGSQIGHIPRKAAEKLAPYMDRNEITLEAQLTNEKGFYEVPIRLFIFGTTDQVRRLELEERLKKDKLLKATQLKQTRTENNLQRQGMGLKSGRGTAGLGSTVYGAPEPELLLEQLTQASQAVQFRTSEDFVRRLAVDEDTLSTMPKAKQPESLCATLLPYQLQGLAWLRAKENPRFPAVGSSDSTQLWKLDRQGLYVNLASNFRVKEAPKLLSGGILADDMGLGKTLQIISLILTGGAGPTLIVAPVSVMSNWEQQIRRHVLDKHLPKILIYHGASRQSAKDKLAMFDVVITSYGTLSHETDHGELNSVQWRRVVLDEGHNIRNARTKMAEAACSLKAQSRWVLTGTPIINSVKDLHSLLQFLRITGGLEQSDVFTSLIARPLAMGQPHAEALLQALMQDLCLRRKKDMKFVDLKLPPKTEYIHRITFKPDEKKKYDALLTEAKGALRDFQNKSGAKNKGMFQSVLERFLRLRQICCHWTLCRKRVEDLLKFLEDDGVVALNAKNKRLLQDALRLVIDNQEECPVCIDTLKNPVITHCKHVFCKACISKVIDVQHKCPMCRAELAEDKLVEPAPEEDPDAEEQEYDSEKASSKTEALIKILQATLKNEGSKVIIFSQWTSFLTVIQQQLEEAGYRYTRIDGSMNPAGRDAAIRAIDHDPETRIMLASLAVCSVGLNLVSADTIILADSWWAPAIEDQAVDRVHRLGQTRATTVWRLVMEGTVEERVLDIQAEKRELVTKAFQEKQGKQRNAKETRMTDLVKLLS